MIKPRLLQPVVYGPYSRADDGYHTTQRVEFIRRAWAFAAGVVIGIIACLAAPAVSLIATL